MGSTNSNNNNNSNNNTRFSFSFFGQRSRARARASERFLSIRWRRPLVIFLSSIEIGADSLSFFTVDRRTVCDQLLFHRNWAGRRRKIKRPSVNSIITGAWLGRPSSVKRKSSKTVKTVKIVIGGTHCGPQFSPPSFDPSIRASNLRKIHPSSTTKESILDQFGKSPTKREAKEKTRRDRLHRTITRAPRRQQQQQQKGQQRRPIDAQTHPS